MEQRPVGFARLGMHTVYFIGILIILKLTQNIGEMAFMFHRMAHLKYRIPSNALCLGFILVLLSGGVLVGCQPATEATLPPATAVAEPQPTIAESEAKSPTPAAADNTATPAVEGEGVSTEKKPFQLTILHTNDTYGEVDPCG